MVEKSSAYRGNESSLPVVFEYTGPFMGGAHTWPRKLDGDSYYSDEVGSHVDPGDVNVQEAYKARTNHIGMCRYSEGTFTRSTSQPAIEVFSVTPLRIGNKSVSSKRRKPARRT